MSHTTDSFRSCTGQEKSSFYKGQEDKKEERGLPVAGHNQEGPPACSEMETMAAKTWKIVCAQCQRICEILVAERTGRSITKKQEQKMLLDFTRENCHYF